MSVELIVLAVTLALTFGFVAGMLIARHFLRTAPDNALTAVMAQAQEAQRHLHAQNTKVIEQMLAFTDPSKYHAYRQAATVGVPPGSTAPVTMHQPKPQNGRPPPVTSREVERAIESAVKAADAEMRATSAAPPGPRSITTPSDMERGNGLP